LLPETGINFWPERSHDILAGRGSAAKFFRFPIEMFVLPRVDCFIHATQEIVEIVKCAAPLIVLAAGCRLGKITMTVPARIIAFAVERDIFRFGKPRGVEPVRGMESAAHPEKKISVAPVFGKKILTLMQSNSMQRKHARHALEEISRQTFRGLRPIR
jgi:hypothetical protein